eukprot:5320208-Amphidinium_carterae.1
MSTYSTSLKQIVKHCSIKGLVTIAQASGTTGLQYALTTAALKVILSIIDVQKGYPFHHRRSQSD